MVSSGSYDYTLDGAGILMEAFDRCGMRPTSLTRDNLLSGRRSLNLELVSWSNRGVNLFAVKPFTVQIVANQADYTAGLGVTNIWPYTVSVLDVYLSQINGGGTGINIDRILMPMSRTDYDQYSNKLQPGTPSQYWFQKLESPILTLYQPPLEGYPTYQIAGHLLSRIQKANATSGETVDVDYLALDALCAMLAKRLSVKFKPEKFALLKEQAAEAWELFSDTNREDVPITILPAIGSWYGMRR